MEKARKNPERTCRKIPMTGGPCSGKSTLLKLIQEQFSRSQVRLVPEMAAMFLNAGFPKPSESGNAALALRKQKCLQSGIYSAQVAYEGAVEIDADENSVPLVVLDRGTLDNPAYCEQSPEEFFTGRGSSLEKEIERYDTVIHLHTVKDPGLYMDDGTRFETHERALEIDERILASWSAHPNRIIIPFAWNVEEKVAAVMRVIRQELL